MKKMFILSMILISCFTSVSTYAASWPEVSENEDSYIDEKEEVREEEKVDNEELEDITKEDEVRGIHIVNIAGEDRYETAIKISQSTFEKADKAIIAYGGDFPDAMFGGVLATEYNMPILLVKKDTIPENVKKEISRLGVKRVYILGGESVVSKEVEAELKKMGSSFRRVAGKNRFFTALEISFLRESLAEGVEDARPFPGDYSSNMITSGKDYADALSIAPLLGQLLPDDYMNYPPSYPIGGYRLLPYDSRFGEWGSEYGMFVIGGPNAVPISPVFKDWDGGIRIAGANRYATAVEIAKLYPLSAGKNIDTIVLASGLNYPDALAAAPFVASQDAALLLTHPSRLSAETKKYIIDNKIEEVVVLGSTNAVSLNVIEELKAIKFE